MSAQAKEGPAPDLVNVEIDGKPVSGPKGAMIIELTDAAGCAVPRFCYHKKLSIAANCRMCLVDVEKAPKPMPACATPVMEGMKIYTRSKRALDAQRNVMEFLLINHPLDCPICDQGGECELQDVAMGYGRSVSRFTERKRVVEDENLGPLVATDMTRCIHCTRCVRFLHEIGGTTEMGGMGRGEHTEIGTYIGRSLASELSGNIIDVCPVGALTNKVFRFRARPWELIAKASIGYHDSLGSNLWMHLRRGEVMRCVPRENDDINEVWLSDRDRYSHAGLQSEQRLTQPMMTVDGKLVPCDWDTALSAAIEALKEVREAHGGEQIGALTSANASAEELYLLQSLLRSLDSHNIDHRLRQLDLSDSHRLATAPSLGGSLASLAKAPGLLLVGSHPRHDQPLLGHRVRQAWMHGAVIGSLHSVRFDCIYQSQWERVVAPAQFAGQLAGLLACAATATNQSLPADVAALVKHHGSTGDDAETRALIAALCKDGARILLGDFAVRHPQAALLRQLAHHLGAITGAAVGEIADGANSVAAWKTGAVPHRLAGGEAAPAAGLDCQEMLEQPRRAYVLYGAEAPEDFAHGGAAVSALAQADAVIAFASYNHPTLAAHASVILPIGLPPECGGTFINAEGDSQRVAGAAKLPGEARPGWRVLRALGGRMDLPGFEFADLESLQNRLDEMLASCANEPYRVDEVVVDGPADAGLEAAVCVSIYSADAVLRHAKPLQATILAERAIMRLHPDDAHGLGLTESGHTRLSDGREVAVEADERVAPGTVWVPAGLAATLPGMRTGTRINLATQESAHG